MARRAFPPGWLMIPDKVGLIRKLRGVAMTTQDDPPTKDRRPHNNFCRRFLNQGLAQPNHKDIPHDQRTIDDGIPNHQFVWQQDFDDVPRTLVAHSAGTVGAPS
jgi:hypothetical protein